MRKDLVYPNYELKLEPGSKVLVYTDGVPESMDNDDEEFGMERLLQAVNSRADGRPEDILMVIDRDVYRFTGEAEQFDDLTMLCVEFCTESR